MLLKNLYSHLQLIDNSVNEKTFDAICGMTEALLGTEALNILKEVVKKTELGLFRWKRKVHLPTVFRGLVKHSMSAYVDNKAVQKEEPEQPLVVTAPESSNLRRIAQAELERIEASYATEGITPEKQARAQELLARLGGTKNESPPTVAPNKTAHQLRENS